MLPDVFGAIRGRLGRLGAAALGASEVTLKLTSAKACGLFASIRVRSIVERKSLTEFNGHLHRCVHWHDTIERLAIGPDSAYVRDLSLFGGDDRLDEGGVASGLLAELELVIAGASSTLVEGGATSRNWLRALAFGSVLDALVLGAARKEAVDRDPSRLTEFPPLEVVLAHVETGRRNVSPNELLEAYSSTLQALGIPMAYEERPYADFYRNEGMGDAIPVELSPEDIQTMADASHDLSQARLCTANESLQDGWARLPASIQHFVTEVDKWKRQGGPARVMLSSLKRKCGQRLLEEHMAHLQRPAGAKLGPQDLAPFLQRERALIERFRSP